MYQQQSTVAVLILVMPSGEGFSQIKETKPFAEIKITARTQKKCIQLPLPVQHISQLLKCQSPVHKLVL